MLISDYSHSDIAKASSIVPHAIPKATLFVQMFKL